MRRDLLYRTWMIRLAPGALIGLALAACSLASEPIPAGPIESGPLPGEIISADVPLSLPRAAQGERIYVQNCAACHGPDGGGGGEFAAQIAQQGGQLPDLSDPALAAARTPQEWFRIITSGNIQNLMPPWADALTEAQRWDVTYYLYTLSAPPEVLSAGRALYEANLAADYGPRGEGIGLDSLAAIAALSRDAIRSTYLSGSDLTGDEQIAVAAYMQTFGYDASLQAVTLQPPGGDTAAEPAEPETGEPEAAEAGEAAPEAEAAPPPGTVEGVIRLESSDITLPAGLPVTLRGLAVSADNQVFEFLVRSTTAGEDGTYRFEDVPFDQERAAYIVEVLYDGVTFSNGEIVDTTITALTLPVTVYPSTTDPAVVRVDAMHLIVQEHPGALLVTQVAVFSNTSDRIFVTEEPVSGGRRGSVAISLPADAYSLQLEDGQIGGRFIPAPDRIYDTAQLYPGDRSHAIVASYFLPFDGPRDITLPIFYQTARVTLLLQDGMQARSDQMNEAGVEVIDQTAYRNYLGQDLAAGDSLTIRIRAAGQSTSLLPSILLVVAGVLLVGGGAYWLIQRRGTQPRAGLSPQAGALASEIAELDAAFEAGRISRFDYEARRAALKAALAEEMEGGE